MTSVVVIDNEDSGSIGRVWEHIVATIKFVVPMLMLVWITCSGYKLAVTSRYTKTSDNNSEGSCVALVFGAVTVIFGLVYFVIGLTIVADLALDLLAWFHRTTKMGISTDQEEEQTTYCRIVLRRLAVTVSILMLTWALYYGYKIASEAQEVIIYERLAFLIGIVSMAFGFIYFIIGLGIVAEYVLHLSDRLRPMVSDPMKGMLW